MRCEPRKGASWGTLTSTSPEARSSTAPVCLVGAATSGSRTARSHRSMVAGMPWDWETIPEYLDSLDRSPKGVNVIQYMPTASLMTYVMGLEAAKSRPATDQERKEMQRLLHEGMEAGLAGFSIQRLGPNSVQADFDGTPMGTATMGDEDILCLADVLAEREEGFIQMTQATGDIKADLAFVEKLAEVAN